MAESGAPSPRSEEEALAPNWRRCLGAIPLRLAVPLVTAGFVLVIGGAVYMGLRQVALESVVRAGRSELQRVWPEWQSVLQSASGIEAARVAFSSKQRTGEFMFSVLLGVDGQVLAASEDRWVGQTIDGVLPAELNGTPFADPTVWQQVRASLNGQVIADPGAAWVAGLWPVDWREPGEEQAPVGLLLLMGDLSTAKAETLLIARAQKAWIGLLLVALGMAVGFLFHFLFVRRLAGVADAADRLAAGDRSVHAEVEGQDEIAQLGRSFESMLADLKEREEALLKSERRHRSLFENAVEGVITMGEDRRIQSVNPAAQTMFGYSEAELVGQNVKILMPEPYRGEHDGYVKSYVTTGKKKIIGIGREAVGQRKDGSQFPLDLSIAEARLPGERIFTGIVRDITGRKEAEEALQRLNEDLEDLVGERTKALEDAQEALVKKERLATLGQLAGSVAHEIRNPLGIVRNAAYYLEQIADDTADKDVLDSHDEIRRGLTRANRIITELLDYARDPKSHPRPFEISSVVRDAFEGVEIAANITVDRSSPNPSPVCYADPEQMTRVINNLIVNAAQAMVEGGGALTTRCFVEGDRAIVEVSDTGTGMSPEQLERVFEPLFTTKTRGIGLGLALAMRYVDLNGAEIEAESKLGEGSVFRVSLPLHQAGTMDQLKSPSPS